MNLGPQEAYYISHYADVRRRIAYPPKKRIEVVDTGARVRRPIRAVGATTPPPSIRYEFDRRKALEMFRAGATFHEIGDACEVPTETMRKLIRRERWKRE